MADLGVPLGGSTIAQYEKGTVWAPDPGVLWGLATIYEQPLELLIAMLRTNRAEPTLDSFEGRDLGPARVRPSASDERLRAVGTELADVARQLATMAMTLQNQTAPAVPSTAGRRSPKIG